MKNSLLFKSVSYKNFHATGNKGVTIALDKDHTTLVYGKNGSGKSTVYEALYFGLYGKSFRKSNKPELVNNINRKRMMVEVKFSVNGKNYKVRRGMVPNVFEIYQGGKLLDQGSSVKDYQKLLEKNILGLSSKSFNQTVILGSLHYVPFMRLPLRDRRDIIEELLDIQIFSYMNVCAKSQMSELNILSGDIDSQLGIVENSLTLVSKHIKDIEDNSKEQKKLREEEIRTKKDQIKLLETEKQGLMEQQITIAQEQLDEVSSQIAKWQKYDSLSRKEKRDLQKELDFFVDNDICNTCHQDITPEFKEEIVNKIQTRLTKLNGADDTIREKIKIYTEELEEINKVRDKMADLRAEAAALNSRIDSLNTSVLELKKKNTKESDKRIEPLKDQYQEYKKRKHELLQEKSKLTSDLDEYEFILRLLKDDGIKSIIIKKWIPVINKLISKYLSILGFPIKFTFDENFKENIIVKGRKDLSYASFSAGEKMRVDLALLFAFREVPIIRSGQGTNLLIFDEVADSAMDLEGWDSFMSIIHSIADKSNVFVISPRGDQLVDKFDNSIRFEKKASFSVLGEVT